MGPVLNILVLCTKGCNKTAMRIKLLNLVFFVMLVELKPKRFLNDVGAQCMAKDGLKSKPGA